jgi:hypothetical protein
MLTRLSDTGSKGGGSSPSRWGAGLGDSLGPGRRCWQWSELDGRRKKTTDKKKSLGKRKSWLWHKREEMEWGPGVRRQAVIISIKD